MQTEKSFPRIYAMARPQRIVEPARSHVAALTRPEVFDRWNGGLRAASGDSADNVITMYDMIGYDFWSGGGVTAKSVAGALRAIGDRDVVIHMNSPGGDMFEGIAIYNLLREHPGQVTVKILGLAASAASVIAMAGDRVEIGAASFLMIHNCWVVAMGNRNDLEEAAKFLKPFDDAMATVYAQRSGRSEKDIMAMMDAETWIPASQAIEQGFADGLLPADAAKDDKSEGDKQARANAARQAEIAMCGKMTRADARALVARLKGTPGAASDDGTPGAAVTLPGGEMEAGWAAGAQDLLASLRRSKARS